VAVVVACDGENGSVRATAEALRLRPAWHQRRLEKEIGHGNAGLLPWSAFVDETESVRELMWPQSISTYNFMRTDGQIASLLLAFTLPIRRYRWYIDPNEREMRLSRASLAT
jgi:hypothetical protein